MIWCFLCIVQKFYIYFLRARWESVWLKTSLQYGSKQTHSHFTPAVLCARVGLKTGLNFKRAFSLHNLYDIFLHFLSLTSRRHYWEFEIQDKEVPRCPELEMEGTNTSCIFYFSICEKVPSYCPAGSGICLAKKVSPLKYPNITLYTRFIDIGTASEVFDSGRTLVLFSQHSQ